MLKKLKSLFIIEEDSQNSKGSANSKTDIDKPKSEKKKMGNTYDGNITEVSKDDKFVTILLQAIESNNLDGFDYIEYKQSLQSLASMEMDEATRFKSAYAMASTMGVDKAKLVESVEHYLQILKNEESEFSQALSSQMKTKVEVRKSEIEQINNTIIEKEQRIAQLHEELKGHQSEMDALSKEIDGAKQKVEHTKSQFYAAYQHVSQQMDDDLNKINKYL